MTKQVDVIIIGGGIFGAALLFYLTRQSDMRVILLEKQQFCAGATGKSGGFVRVLHTASQLTALALDSLAEFENFESITGQSCGFKQTGFFYIANQGYSSELVEQTQMLKERDYPISCLSAMQADSYIGKTLPLNSHDRIFYEPRGGYADPAKATLAYLNAAKRQGGQAFEGEEVISLSVNSRVIVGAKTTHREYSANTVVIAAGSASSMLLQQCDMIIEGLNPKQIHVGIYRYPKDVSCLPTFINREMELYGRHYDSEHFLLGMTHVSDPNINKQVNEGLHLRAKNYLPWFADDLWVKNHSGIDMYSHDQNGIAGFLPELKGLFLLTGWGGIGFKIAPACAKQAAKELLAQC